MRAGDVVRMRGSDGRGTVEEVRGDRVVVRAQGLRLTLPASDVERAADADSAGRQAPGPRETTGGERESAAGAARGPD